MKTDNNNLNELFEGLDFNTAKPETGHKERFFQKLKEQNPGQKPKVRSLWTPILSIAASITLALLLFGNLLNPNQEYSKGDLASVSPEMKETQDFYSSLIQKELNTLEAEKSPETQAIVKDALLQMEKLENQYAKLKKDLLKSGNDNRVIYAMINNFQQRIDLLQQVLDQIENIKSFKTQNHESTTI